MQFPEPGIGIMSQHVFTHTEKRPFFSQMGPLIIHSARATGRSSLLLRILAETYSLQEIWLC